MRLLKASLLTFVCNGVGSRSAYRICSRQFGVDYAGGLFVAAAACVLADENYF